MRVGYGLGGDRRDPRHVTPALRGSKGVAVLAGLPAWGASLRRCAPQVGGLVLGTYLLVGLSTYGVRGAAWCASLRRRVPQPLPVYVVKPTECACKSQAPR